ncbi:RNA-binding protein fusilli, partial [Caerostris extrusa]
LTLFQLTTECIQVQRNSEVRPNGDAMVTFPAARIEAERALQEKNRQNINNRYIELFMA